MDEINRIKGMGAGKYQKECPACGEIIFNTDLKALKAIVNCPVCGVTLPEKTVLEQDTRNLKGLPQLLKYSLVGLCIALLILYFVS